MVLDACEVTTWHADAGCMLVYVNVELRVKLNGSVTCA